MSGSPTETELKLMLQSFVDAREQNRTYFDDTMLGLLDTLEQSAEGDFMPAAISRYAASVRGGSAGVMATDGAFLGQWLAEFGKFIGSPAGGSDTPRLIRDTYQWFIDNAKFIASRQITYATPAAGGSNVGSGLVSRLTVDENGESLEAVTIEAKTLIVRQDQVGGAQRGEEVWELHGVEPSPDGLGSVSAGSGVTQTVITRHSGSGGSLLTNSNFDEPHDTDTTSSTKVAGWEITSNPTNIAEALGSSSANNIFVEAPGVLTDDSRSIQFTGNATIRQLLGTGIPLDSATPYFLRVMVRRQSSCNGTLTLSLGTHSVSVDLTTHTNDTWEELLLTIGQNSWPSQFYEDEIDVSIALASNTTGNVLVDAVILTAFDLADGSYYNVRTGATPFALDDVFTWTDTGGAPTTAKIQYVLSRNGFYLPATTGAGINWADP